MSMTLHELDSLVEQRIAKLEQDKAELLAALENIASYTGLFPTGYVYNTANEVIAKHKAKP